VAVVQWIRIYRCGRYDECSNHSSHTWFADVMDSIIVFEAI
jgi:hypothetical protein